ncbi:MAG: DUF4349 domain-containing protein [Bacillota bacterium]|nr:DUF4349 domain-containing protein [Bacillota bacterium]MDW7683438.1 DUF4349 domain-containing protein [Bacillota bacterium]
MMRRILAVMLVLVVALLFVGCGATQDFAKGGYDSDNSAPAAPSEEMEYDGAKREISNVSPDGSYANAEQKLIRTGEISLDVETLDAALDEINHIVRVTGGFFAHSSISGPEDARRAYLTLRLPADKFEDVMADISELGKLLNENKGGEDVTLQYVDLEARIRNMERQEERLLEILDKAETVEDILRVEQELARVRGQLETMTAEFRYLRDRVDYATIHVSLRETPTASPTITGSGLKGVWQRARLGLVNSVNSMLTGLGNFLVLLVSALPYLVFLAVVGVPVAILFKRFGKRGPRTPDA